MENLFLEDILDQMAAYGLPKLHRFGVSKVGGNLDFTQGGDWHCAIQIKRVPHDLDPYPRHPGQTRAAQLGVPIGFSATAKTPREAAKLCLDRMMQYVETGWHYLWPAEMHPDAPPPPPRRRLPPKMPVKAQERRRYKAPPIEGKGALKLYKVHLWSRCGTYSMVVGAYTQKQACELLDCSLPYLKNYGKCLDPEERELASRVPGQVWAKRLPNGHDDGETPQYYRWRDQKGTIWY